MPAILIHSFDGDVHAKAVMWALNGLGQDCSFWPSGKFPAEQHLSLTFASSGNRRSSPLVEADSRKLPAANVVWNRRPHGPKLSTTLPESEHEFAEIESRLFLHSMMRLAAPGALWINPPHVAESDSYKPLQLSLAVKAGFRAPETLFSNDPDAIADFYRRHKGEVVYKCFRANAWTLEDGSGRIYAMNRTVPVLPEDLERREALSAAPGIFQHQIEKAFELRVTAMGRTLIAARIDSQAHEATREDWRSGQHLLEIEPFDLPEEIAERCRSYMRAPEATFADYLASDAGRAFEARTDPTESAKRLFAPA